VIKRLAAKALVASHRGDPARRFAALLPGP